MSLSCTSSRARAVSTPSWSKIWFQVVSQYVFNIYHPKVTEQSDHASYRKKRQDCHNLPF